MLGLSGGLTCEACVHDAPPIVQAAVHGHFLGFAFALWVWAAIVAIVSIVLSLTTFGRRTYAIGNNERRELSRRHQRAADDDLLCMC